MHLQLRFRGAASATRVVARFASVASLLAALVFIARPARAQNSPTQAIGRIEGADVSVDSGMPASVATANAPASIYVSNGSAVTVHSGKARLTLFAGGELDICGPAKFTILTSGDAITLALNFGHLHVQLPAKTSLRIFSPTIIATPIDINGGTRDVTVGLDLNDSLCVLATSGAIQLEHQFSGEKLIVPQAGEFFLNAGRLVPVAGSPGSCNCSPMPQRAAPRAPTRIPDFAESEPTTAAPDRTIVAPEPAPAPAAASEPPAIEITRQPSATFAIPLDANEAHPSARPTDEHAGEAPAVAEPARETVTPLLEFNASEPQPPDEAAPELMLLVKEARVSPGWEFDGHVNAPEFAEAMQRALGEESPAKGAEERSSAGQPGVQPDQKRGFWAALKRLFGGTVEADEPAQ
jgi:hypothetical protein